MERNKEKIMMCDCENCRIPWYQSYHRHFFLRWVLGFMILGLTFAIGFKLGEFKQIFDSLGFGTDTRDTRPLMFFDRGGGMTGTYQAPVQTTTSTKSTK